MILVIHLLSRRIRIDGVCSEALYIHILYFSQSLCCLDVSRYDNPVRLRYEGNCKEITAPISDPALWLLGANPSLRQAMVRIWPLALPQA